MLANDIGNECQQHGAEFGGGKYLAHKLNFTDDCKFVILDIEESKKFDLAFFYPVLLKLGSADHLSFIYNSVSQRGRYRPPGGVWNL